LFADMLPLPNDGRFPAIELIPEQRRKRTLEALVSQLEPLTQRSPVLMILEDAHWADPRAWKCSVGLSTGLAAFACC
jgi:predicted ATPase